MASSSSVETLQWCKMMFEEVRKNLPHPYQSEGDDIFIRLANISQNLINGVPYTKYSAEEVDNLNNRAFDFLVKIQNPFPIYDEVLNEFYKFFYDRWYYEWVDQMIAESMD